MGTVVGVVHLQSRSNHSGARVTLVDGGTYSATTVANGAFTITGVAVGVYTATASMPGYLYAQRGGVTVVTGTTVLPLVNLDGGNADNDGDIDIFDLTILGANFGLTVPPGDARADINGDLWVNIFDLVKVGIHYGALAPLPWP